MPAKKIKDIAVKTGEYTDRSSGETKGRYLNVGALMKNEDGSVFILLQRTFNPAGINSDRDTVLLSCFDLREQGEQSSGGERSAPPAGERPPARRPSANAPAFESGGLDDDIPF